LLSKAAVVMLPVVLLGCVWWRRGKIQWRDIRSSLPFFGLSLVLGLVTVWFQHNQSAQAQLAQGGGLFSRLTAAGWMPWFYLYKTFLPVGLNVIYPDWQIDTSHWVSYMPGLLLVGSFALFWWKRRSWGRPLLFGLGYFVVTLFPVLGFFRQSFHRFSLVADHWQYFSIIGVIALVVASAEKMFRRLDQRTRYWTAVAGAAVLAALGVATWTRAAVYRDSETLWRDTVAKNPKAWAGYNNLGLILLQSGKTREAIEHFQRALQLKPDYADAHYNLGIAFAQTDRIEDAINQYEQALRLAPDSAETHNNLGIALKQVGRLDDAISHYEQALRITPNDAEVHYNLATTLRQVGKNNEAIVHFEQAVRINPDFVGAHYNLGAALVKAGRTEEAIQQFEQALRLKPDFNEHNKLGIALMQMGKLPDAIRHFEQALRLDPNLPEVHYNLAAAFERTGKFNEAIREYEQAMRLKPDFAEAQRGWARLQSIR
jgi:protein O-mannosyl-transferase